MKRLFLLACLALIATPYVARADWDDDDHDRDDRHHHHHINGSEMPAVGIAAAAMIGVAGYLMLRRKNAVQN